MLGRIDQETADTEGGHKNIKKNRPAHVYVWPGSVGHKMYCRKLLLVFEDLFLHTAVMGGSKIHRLRF